MALADSPEHDDKRRVANSDAQLHHEGGRISRYAQAPAGPVKAERGNEQMPPRSVVLAHAGGGQDASA
jgi:hypothetical protein